MVAGQIRSLRNFGIIGSTSVYINLLIIFMSMGVVAHSLPNYAVANAADDTIGYGPVIVQAFNSQDLVGQINGMFNMVRILPWHALLIHSLFITGLCTLLDFGNQVVYSHYSLGLRWCHDLPEMMAEMRRPMDFYKGMAFAQLLIFCAYMTYGVFCKLYFACDFLVSV